MHLNSHLARNTTIEMAIAGMAIEILMDQIIVTRTK